MELKSNKSASDFASLDSFVTKPVKNIVNTNPRQGLVAKPFRDGFDGILSKNDKLSVVLQVLHPRDNEGFLMAHIRRYYPKKDRFHTGVYLTEFEYNMLIDVLTMARGGKPEKPEDSVFEKNTKTRFFKVTLLADGALVHQQSNGNNRYLKLSKKQMSRLVRKYARFEHFLKIEETDADDSDDEADESDNDEAADPTTDPKLMFGITPQQSTTNYPIPNRNQLFPNCSIGPYFK